MSRTSTCTSGKGFDYCEEKAYASFLGKGEVPAEVQAEITKKRAAHAVTYKEAKLQEIARNYKVLEKDSLDYVERLLND